MVAEPADSLQRKIAGDREMSGQSDIDVAIDVFHSLRHFRQHYASSEAYHWHVEELAKTLTNGHATNDFRRGLAELIRKI
ncbi:hypothetical protein [Dongia sedimenti]|uniref:Uncharacterized protein n=1 Tax=Dongia sedimenti TaxID=3064282 RepID=A0ABU0YTJ0_9PROT|nr:hypothetical protein [Rhodospirillaceae bacterium R-7]